MFFLRCIFWLSIVYASMSWPNGTLSRVRDEARHVSERSAASLAADAGDLCVKHASDCLAGAAHLDELLRSTLEPQDSPEAKNTASLRTSRSKAVPAQRKTAQEAKVARTP